MARRQSVRVCPICSKNNPAHAPRCGICGEDMSWIAPRALAAETSERRRNFGAPERAILGFGAGAFVGCMLALAPFVNQVPDDVALEMALSGNGMVLMVILGLVGGALAALTAHTGPLLMQFSANGGIRRPCPYCAEMIRSQAVICRYCNRSV